MKISKTKFAAASFGAAMTSLYSAPELNAQLVDLTFTPGGPVPFVNLNAEANYGVDVNFAAGGFSGNVTVFNNLDLYGDPVGLIFSGFSAIGSLNTTSGVLEPGDIFDGDNATAGFSIGFEASSTGVRYIGFLADAGNLGWFSIDLGDNPGMPGNEVTILDGQLLQNTPIGGTITIPGPPAFALGDVNTDGAVDFLDLGPFIERLGSGEFQTEADIDGSGQVDFLDLGPFIELLSGGGSTDMGWSDSTGMQQLINDPPSVGLEALALGADGLRQRRQATAAA